MGERAGLDLGIDALDVVDGSGSNALIYGVVLLLLRK